MDEEISREIRDLRRRLDLLKPGYPAPAIRCTAPRGADGYPRTTLPNGEAFVCRGAPSDVWCAVRGIVCPHLRIGIVLKEEDDL